MFKRTALSTAVVVALGVSAGSNIAVAEEVEKLEKIQVTGSRISRVDVEGATPVTVISREDIERSGQLTVADVLRNSTYNSFGSYSERSGSSWQSNAFINMRGLGASRTLVLLNGKRMPQAGARGDGAVNINAIPAAAVESIEILADGASAVYGSDAIGGVVNIMLKKDFEGITVEVGTANPKLKGGDEANFSITGGTSNERGNILFSFEHDEKDIIYSRDYKPSSSGLSIYGRNIQGYVGGVKTDRKALAGVDCSGLLVPSGGECMYNYANAKAETAESKRDQFVISSNYSLTNDIEWSNEAVIGLNRSFGQYAPAAGFFTVKQGTVGGAPILAANGFDADKDATMFYRFNKVGTRDNEVKDLSAIFTSALNGSVETSFVGDVDWNLAVRYSKALSDEKGTGYVLRNVAEEALNEGKYGGFDPATGEFSDEATRQMSYDTSRDIEVSYADISGGVQFDFGELFGNTLSWYVGTEFSRQDYKDKYDAQSAADNVIGSSGNSSGGDRKQKAFFVETLIPLHDMVELNLAARYDKYDDFGSAVSPKASVRVQPLDNLVLRSSFAKGFRAPGLTSLYQANANSADYAVDYVKCARDSITACDGNKKYDRQYDTVHASNKDLKAEKSESFNFGVVYTPIEDLNLGIDYYNIEVTDVVNTPTLQELIDAEVAGKGTDGLITRDANGEITAVTIKPINQGTLSTSGIDLKADYNHEMPFGTLTYAVNGSYVLEYKQPAYYKGPEKDIVGGNIGNDAFPEYRVNADLGWISNDGMHKVNFGPRHVAGYTYNKGKSGEKEVSSWTSWDLNYQVSLPWEGVVKVGARNLFDRDAPLPTDSLRSQDQLANYDWKGRTLYASYTQSF
ncbi:TonB-dependent receptor plug domain-containing protein [Spongorhabdus nitratireducens]